MRGVPRPFASRQGSRGRAVRLELLDHPQGLARQAHQQFAHGVPLGRAVADPVERDSPLARGARGKGSVRGKVKLRMSRRQLETRTMCGRNSERSTPARQNRREEDGSCGAARGPRGPRGPHDGLGDGPGRARRVVRRPRHQLPGLLGQPPARGGCPARTRTAGCPGWSRWRSPGPACTVCRSPGPACTVCRSPGRCARAFWSGWQGSWARLPLFAVRAGLVLLPRRSPVRRVLRARGAP